MRVKFWILVAGIVAGAAGYRYLDRHEGKLPGFNGLLSRPAIPR